MRRTSIKFGLTGVGYVVALALATGAANFTQSNLLFWAVGLMIGAGVISVACALVMLRGLEVQRLAPSNAVAGEPLMIRYRITNRSAWLPALNFTVSEVWPGQGLFRRAAPGTPLATGMLRGRTYAWTLHLPPRASQQTELPCYPVKRGLLELGCVEIVSGFPFGLLRKQVRVSTSDTVLIFPPLVPVRSEFLSQGAAVHAAGRIRKQRTGDGHEFFGLRKYREGDSPRSVDWKRSARLGTLISREMTHSSPPRLMLLLDLSPSKDQPAKSQAGLEDELAELAVSLTASLVCEGHLRGMHVGLAIVGVPGSLFPPHHSIPHRTRLLEELAKLDLTKRSQARQNHPFEPSVLIHTGTRESLQHTGRMLVLTSRNLSRYVDARTPGVQQMLRKSSTLRENPVANRQEPVRA